MYTYSIFLVKKKVAMHYHYKTGILQRFFQEYQENRKRTYLKLQYRYITEPFTLDKLYDYYREASPGVILEKREYYIQILRDCKQLNIYQDERHITFSCHTLDEAEDIIFPLLHNLPFHFFVIEHHRNDYGWVFTKKMKKNHYKQILYSYP